MLPRALAATGRSRSARVPLRHKPRANEPADAGGRQPGPRMHTEAEIQAWSVDPVKPLNRPITFVEYDPAWPGLFEREATRIRSILGDRVLRLEHTGSTSVPGLAAKPVIDITMTVADVLDEPAYAADLEAAGYRLVIREHEPEWYDHRVFNGPDTRVNLHVFSAGCREVDRMVGFRDWLRTHDEDRALYEATKRDLLKRDWKFVQNYADAKGEVVEQIAARAGIGGPHPGPPR
jgi:GrpB-like predicted nucleotidyltransferase (UPF0157 family)